MVRHVHSSQVFTPGLPAFSWLSSYVASHCLAVVPQSGAKQIFYCAVYYITFETVKLGEHLKI
jgi:hypothetical protein